MALISISVPFSQGYGSLIKSLRGLNPSLTYSIQRILVEPSSLGIHLISKTRKGRKFHEWRDIHKSFEADRDSGSTERRLFTIVLFQLFLPGCLYSIHKTDMPF